MGADKSTENTPNAQKYPKIYMPNLSAQAQKFVILMKKASSGIHSLWSSL